MSCHIKCDQVWETVWLWSLCEAKILLLWPQGEHRGLQTGAAVLQRCHQCCRVSGDHSLSPQRLTSDDDCIAQARYKCCGVSVDSSTMRGCSQVYPCCDQDQSHEGCERVCRRCGGTWGTRGDRCYKRPHNTVTKQR